MKSWSLSRVITPVYSTYGAPMGGPNVGKRPADGTKVYKKHVRLADGYDKGGAYWGAGEPLFVEFTPDLSYIEYTRG